MGLKYEGTKKEAAELIALGLAQRGYKVKGEVAFSLRMEGDERGGESYPVVAGFVADVEHLGPLRTSNGPANYDQKIEPR